MSANEPPTAREVYLARPDVMGLELVEAMDRAKSDVDSLLALVALHRAPPYRTLDLGAGIGSIAIELGLRGHATLGFEQVPEFVTAAKGLAAKLGTYCNARFVQADAAKARPILEGLQFDLLLVLNGVLGESADEVADRRALADLRSVAAPGAVIVIALPNALALASGPGVREERITATADESDELVIDVRYRTRAYTPGEMGRMLAETGWRVVDARGDLAGGKLEESSPRFVLVALAA